MTISIKGSTEVALRLVLVDAVGKYNAIGMLLGHPIYRKLLVSLFSFGRRQQFLPNSNHGIAETQFEMAPALA